MTPSRVAAAVLAVMATHAGAAPDERMADAVRHAWAGCRALEDADERLRCYDRLQELFEPPRFRGRLSETTPNFVVDRPTLLRYQSDGPVFVMAVQDADGAIVQNLHIGGSGEASYLIARPGTYRLQIGGTEGWRVWLEPQTPASAAASTPAR